MLTFDEEQLNVILDALEGWRSMIYDVPTQELDALIDQIQEHLK